jgi:hypothetical protein
LVEIIKNKKYDFLLEDLFKSLNNGYSSIGINKKSYKSHRLAWLYMCGYFPKNIDIDHENRVRDYKKEYSDLRKSDIRTLKYSLRNRIYQAFKFRKTNKDKTTSKLLGCSFKCVKKHIESKFDNQMNWGNYGKWHIDHIKPLAEAKTKEQLEDLCHYSNLQPLWAKDNLRKGCRF